MIDLQQLAHPEFCFIETAIGGVQNRNRVVEISSADVSGIKTEAYVSIYRFRQELQKHVEDTGSVSGSKHFPVWSDFLWFDIDDEDPEKALQQARQLVINIEQVDPALTEHISCYWSGCKGFHISLPSSLAGLKPSVELPLQHKALTLALAKDVPIDTSIYEHARLLRLPNTINNKSGLYKVPLTYDQLSTLTIQEIKSLAAKPLGDPYIEILPESQTPAPNCRLTELAADTAKPASDQSQPLASSRVSGQDWIVDTLRGLRAGNRHDSFLRIIGRFCSDGLSQDAIIELLSPHVQRSAYPEDEFRNLVTDVCTRYDNSFSSFGYNKEKKKNEITFVTLPEYLKIVDPDVRWLVDGLIPLGGVTIIAGHPGSAKSFIQMELAYAVATGTAFLGEFDTQSGVVLYIDEENDPPEMRRRLRRMQKGRSLDDPPSNIFLAVGQGVKFSSKSNHLDRLDRLLEQVKPSVVLIDSFIRFVDVDENSSNYMAGLFERIRHLMAKHQCCFVMVDHYKKPTGNYYGSMHKLRGSSDKLAFLEALLTVSKSGDRFVIEHSKSRQAIELDPMRVELSDPEEGATTIRFVEFLKSMDQEETRAAISFLTDALSDGGKTTPELISLAGKNGISPAIVRKGLKQMVKTGVVRVEKTKPSGRGAPADFYTLAKSTDSEPPDQNDWGAEGI